MGMAEDHQAAIYSLERTQAAAAYMAARLSDDKLGQAALARSLGSNTDFIHGLCRLVEQLAVDNAQLTGRSPAEVVSNICGMAAAGIELRRAAMRQHPSAGQPPPG